MESAAPRAAQLARAFGEIGSLDPVAQQKTLGTIAMCAFETEVGGAAYAREVSLRALESGLFVRPLGNVLYLWPPLVTTEAELDGMLDRFNEAIQSTAPVAA